MPQRTPPPLEPEVLERLSGAEIYTRACPLLVPLVEEGWTDNEIAERTVAFYLESLKASGIDTLLLGCTHYPLLRGLFERVLGPGMAAGFPAGKSDGHCLVNRGSRDVVYLEVGDRRPGDEVAYPDDDLAALWRDGRRVFAHSDGTPY